MRKRNRTVGRKRDRTIDEDRLAERDQADGRKRDRTVGALTKLDHRATAPRRRTNGLVGMALDLVAELDSVLESFAGTQVDHAKKPEIDMSDEAVTRRLEEVRALYKLMVSLREARVAAPPKR